MFSLYNSVSLQKHINKNNFTLVTLNSYVMKKRVRLKQEEVEYLGLKVKEAAKSGRDLQYTLTDIQVQEISNYRSSKGINPNSGNRYRIKREIAERLGLKLNESNRYRLSKLELSKYLKCDITPIRRLFFDIETSPMVVYSWRTGYKINIGTDNIIQDWKIICISYKWEDEDKVHNFTWDKNQCDKKMLSKFIKIANAADELIAHNGDRFDIKKVRTRCIFHRVPAFPSYRTLDTLKKAKSGFSFNSNRLDYIAKFLGVGAKLEHEGFKMWVKCMQGDKQALKDMVKYCDMDIVVLEDVFLTMQNYIKHNTHNGVINNGYKCSCPTCGSEEIILYKNNFTALGTIKRQMECQTCGYVYETSNSAYRLFLENKNQSLIK